MANVVVQMGGASTAEWTDITCQVLGAGWQRGASADRGVLTVPDAGQATAYFIDPARDLDPANAAGAYAGVIDIGARFRVLLEGAPAFSGRIDTIEHDFEPPTPGYEGVPLARIAATDAVARMAGVKGAATFAAESASVRIGHVLDAAQVAQGVGQRDIEAGGVTVAAGELTADTWSAAVDLLGTELGSLDLRPDGSVIWRNRTSTWQPGDPVLHLGCSATVEARATTVPIGIAAGADDWCLESRGASQAAAADGTGGQFVDRGGQGSLYAGQTTAGATYYAYQSFLRFDTRAIPAGSTISSVVLQASQNDDSSLTDFTFEARAFDWTPPIAPGLASWRTRAQLTALPLRATMPTAGLPAPGQLFTFTSDPSFTGGINAGGYTGLVICSGRTRAGVVPTGNEYAALRAFELGLLAQDQPTPRAALAATLTVTYLPPVHRIALDAMRRRSDRTTVRNRYTAMREGQPAIVEQDQGSIDRYGLRASDVTLDLIDDAAVDDWALFALRRSKDPVRGIENVGVPRASAQDIAAIEAAPLYTGRVHLFQDHYGPPIDETFRLLGVAWEVDDTASASARLVLGTDLELAAVARTYVIDTLADWQNRAFAGADKGANWVLIATGGGAVGITPNSAAAPLDVGPAGADSLTFTWTQQA